jgi:serine/threonine protein kinase
MDIHTRGLGTPSYASPEQLAGGVYGVEIDVFSLGVILAELLCPVQTQMERAVLFEQLRQARRLPPLVEAAFPKASSLALEMTHPDPKGRPTMEQINRWLPLVLGEVREHFCKAPIPSPRALPVGNNPTFEVTLNSLRGHVLAVSPVHTGDNSLYQFFKEDIFPAELGLAPQPMQAEGNTSRAQQKEPDTMARAQHNAQHKEPETKKSHSGSSGQKNRLDFRLLLLLLLGQSAILPGLQPNSQATPPSTTGYRVEIVDTRAYFGLDQVFTDDFTVGPQPSSSSWEIISTASTSQEAHAPCADKHTWVDPGGGNYCSQLFGAIARSQQQDYVLNHIISNAFALGRDA